MQNLPTFKFSPGFELKKFMGFDMKIAISIFGFDNCPFEKI